MTMHEFEDAALSSAIYPNQGNNIPYALFGLLGEAGELANKYKKVLRDDGGVLCTDKRAQMIDELSDVLWYCAALSYELGTTLDGVARRNVAKLTERKAKGTLAGSGDGR